MDIKTIQRRYDLDWMRVIAILLVFVYHSTRFFNVENWHVKNPTWYPWVQVWNMFAASWLMPLIFVISGASLYYALGKGGLGIVGKFIKDKVLRLLVPLVVGVLTHCALQVYLERITHGQFSGSFFQFLPHYFEGIYGLGGNLAIMGMHLWYLLVLFVFSLVCLPLLLLLKSKLGARVLDKVTNVLAWPGVVYVFVLATLLSWKLISPDSILGFDGFGRNLGIYLSCFLAGFVMFSNDRLLASIRRLRWISLAGTIAMTVMLIRGEYHDDWLGWFFIMAFLGFGLKCLNVNIPVLKYANEAVLPFYILHQTVLLSVGYFVVRWAIPDLLKWAIIVPISFAIIMSLYEFLVRRNNIMRFLFGMKLLPKAVAQSQVALASRPEALPSR